MQFKKELALLIRMLQTETLNKVSWMCVSVSYHFRDMAFQS